MQSILDEMRAYQRLNLSVLGADGHELLLEDGRRVLDLYGGHCVNTLGAGDRGVQVLIERQWRKMSFQTNLIDHAPRHEFLASVTPLLPAGAEWSVFTTNCGAEANENALKVALNVTGRSAVVCFKGAFHGRTAAAAAVSDTKVKPFPSSPFEVRRVPFGAIDAATAAIDASVGAVILEPIQSMAGVVEPPPGFLAALRRRCDEVGAFLVFDEVQTGNGRLGRPWASDYYGVLPDLFTTAKGAATGLPIGLTFARREIAARIPAGLLGTTFGGGPLVLTVAAEVYRRMSRPGFLEHVRQLSAAFMKAAVRGPIERVRGAGLLLGLEVKSGLTGAQVRDRLLEQNVLVGTSDDPRVLRVSPQLTLPLAAVDRLAEALDAVAACTAAAS